jgi:hypothetical protein
MLTKREIRKQNCRHESEGISLPEPVTLSEELLATLLATGPDSSESRFARVVSHDAVLAITNAVRLFVQENEIQAIAIRNPANIPEIPRGSCFKYSDCGEDGELQDCGPRMERGVNLVIALVYEEGMLIGYGIAVKENEVCEIEIIDVDYYSRRECGLFGVLDISGESFQVGVGHVVVQTLLQECPLPIRVDATNGSSRYIFNAFGFRTDASTSNPCILKLERYV